MDVIGNRRVWLVAGPSLAAILLAVVMPGQLAFLLGAAAAWAVVATFVFRSRERMEYQAAIRHMRRGDYAEAIRVMDELIKAEPDTLEHRRFRGDLHWLAGDLQRASADYERIIGQAPDLLAGYSKMAGIEMQKGNYDKAREYALTALERDKGWMAAYELGWIEDLQGSAESAVTYLERAFASGIPESRFRLLTRLWLARNYHRLGRDEDARKQIALMRKETKGLREWHAILESEPGVMMRNLYSDDISLAQQLLKAETTLEALD